MTSPAISFNLSQQQIDSIALEGTNLAHMFGLPIEEYLVQRVKNHVTALSETLDIKKLPILLCDGKCAWAE
ncbi:MAG: hypothetical protein CL608_26135 [Anaerolineaceae bacterium]|nr:hypothetical protein [Anaerolineaceae bacterium]